MLESFLKYIKEQKLIDPSDKILLAVSGGVDSVVLCKLLHQAKIKFAIAHCNFTLRGEESDEDELFVEELAELYNVAFHSISFDTNSFAKKNKLSVQVAARELRYKWFEEIKTQFNFTLIATAHHQDDSIETFFINLLRGSGIRGLHGILPKQGDIIRPLLFANKVEIEAFAKKNKLKFRRDSSNETDKYLRNKIRHKLIPLLSTINPSANKNIADTIENLREVETIYLKSIEKKRLKIVEEKNGLVKINIKELEKLKPISAYLFEYLYPLGFNSKMIDDILESLNSESGKQFFSGTHRLIKDRNYLIINTNEKIIDSKNINISLSKKEIKVGSNKIVFKKMLHSKKVDLKVSKDIAQIDFEKLKFPLQLRKWEHGDTFHPIGMKGKKKLSDFFIDQKFSLIEKENTMVLISDNKIVWVVGHRIDDRFKITDKTKQIYFANLLK